LVPIQSDNIDLSLEWYYGADSYFSLGYFEKDVKNFIGTGLEDVPIFDIPNVIGGQLWEDAKAAGGYADTDYGAIGNYIIENNADSPAVNTDVSPAEIYGQAGDPALIWRLTRPVNQREAAVDGVEINLQHTFGDTGFGFIANATFANADIGYDISKPEEGQFVLNGLSDSANLIAFYDKNDLQVRLAYNWRDDFLAGAGQGQGTNTNPTNVEAYGQLDLGITYRATDNLTVYFSGINITEETVHVYGLTKDQVLQAVQGGPRYDLGIRYEFN
jgi:TonB-dependent receptor